MDNFKGPRLPILFLLYVSETPEEICTPIKGAIKLQKMIFILKKEYRISKRTFTSIKFIPHKLGMYSKEIQDDIAFLSNIGLIEAVNRDDFDFDYLMGEEDLNTPVEYRLVDKGREFVEKVIEQAKKSGAEEQKKIDRILKACVDVKKRFNNADIRSLLTYVYNKYPEFTVKSEILNEILGKE